MEDNIKKIISNALLVNKDNLNKHIKSIFYKIKEVIDNNKDIIIEANKIDIKNNNGFEIEFDIIDNIFSNIKKENLFYGDIILSLKDDEKKIIYGNQIMDYGNVVVIYDGNPYITIEIIMRNIIAGNTTILSNNGFMYGTNQLIVNLIQSVLEQFNLSKSFLQLYVTDDYDKLLSNYANIDLVLCIGDNNLQRLILKKSNNKTIVSGYENFEIYIEDNRHLDYLERIINTHTSVKTYIRSDLNLNYPNSIIVDDIDEAIAQINYSGSRYSSSIFTSSNENASKFIKEIKSKMITVNTSPTIERIIDLNQNDLTNKKTIIYPFDFKFDGNSNYINVKEQKKDN